MVDKVYDEKKILYDFFMNDRKILTKSWKYFKKPILSSKLKKELDFVTDKKHGISSYVYEYKQISKKDLNIILNAENVTNRKPLMFKSIKFDLDIFLLNTIKILYKIEKKNSKHNQIEIIKFIKLVYEVVKEYDINLSYEDIKNFYAQNIWKLNYNHNPSRKPEKNITLYDASGNKSKFAYIEF